MDTCSSIIIFFLRYVFSDRSRSQKNVLIGVSSEQSQQIALHVMSMNEIYYAKFNGRYPLQTELKQFPTKLHKSSFAYIIPNIRLESSIIVIVYADRDSC